jgi:hypothetical protein
MHAVSTKTRQQMMRDNAKRPLMLERVPPEQWPTRVRGVIEVWLSRKYLVQVYKEADGMLRASVNRTTLRADGHWEENLTWDEMQEIKRQIGYADRYAIEVLPRDCDIVNVANMRHMWILPAPLPIGWFMRDEPAAGGSGVSGVRAVDDPGIFSSVPVDCFADDRLSKTDIRVFGAACSFRDRSAAGRDPGAEKLAELVRLPVNSVKTAIDRLVVFGYLDDVK